MAQHSLNGIGTNSLDVHDFDKYTEDSREFFNRFERSKRLFEYKDDDCNDNEYLDSDQDLCQESIIAFRVYDSCCHKECLNGNNLRQVHADENIKASEKVFVKGGAVSPPQDTEEIGVDNLRISKILITDKKPNKLEKGFWDITIRYIFEYIMTFKYKNDIVIGTIKVKNDFIQKVTLFGANSPKYLSSTDLLRKKNGDNFMFRSEPFIIVKAKAVLLEPRIYLNRQLYDSSEPVRTNVNITAVIGLFAEVFLFRIVNLHVNNKGICATDECEESMDIDCSLLNMDNFLPKYTRES